MEKKRIEKIVNAMWRWFVSLRLTFILLSVIGIGAVIGMSFDQTVTFDEFYQKRASKGFSGFILGFFELYDAFHSWWFSFAILLLSLNLIACSIERLPRIFFDFIRPRPYLTERRFLGLTLKEKRVLRNKDEAVALVTKFMPIKLRDAHLEKGRDFYYCEKHRFGRFGVYVVHVALLIVMYSSIYATQNGVDGHVLIEEGNKARFITARGPSGVTYTYDLGFYVGCDDFRLRTFVDNTPMEFESDLYISRDAQEKIEKKTVRVNEPLSYAGFTFYQSSYRPSISERIVTIEIKNDSDYQKIHRTKLNTPIVLPSGDSLIVEKIFDDFAGLGQALRLTKKSQNGESTYFHIFRRYKDYDKVREDDYFVTFLESDQQYATGLSIGKNPGIVTIFFGFMVLMVGLYLCFFTTPVRYFARIREEGHGYGVLLGASGFRNPNSVKEIFIKKMANVDMQSE